MTREEIIALARQAGATPYTNRHYPERPTHTFFPEALESFAGLVLEAAALECEKYQLDQWALYKGRAPYTGQEPGRADQMVQGQSYGAEWCADLIRAMKPGKEKDRVSE